MTGGRFTAAVPKVGVMSAPASFPIQAVEGRGEVSEPSVRRSEEQGRLFWVWLLTLPIILMLAASLAFGAPWPGPTVLRIAMVALAFPVVFGVGEPLFREARRARRQGRWNVAIFVALSECARMR